MVTIPNGLAVPTPSGPRAVPNVPTPQPRIPTEAPGTPGTETLFIYDWDSAVWDQLPSDQEVRLDSAARYVNSEGTIQVEVRSQFGRGPFPTSPPEIAVEGWMPG